MLIVTITTRADLVNKKIDYPFRRHFHHQPVCYS